MDPITMGALLGGGASLLGGMMSNQANQASAREATNASMQSSREQMAFQERMSSTAHQREVTDLKAAGLNPILAVNAGASSPQGASGSGQAARHENIAASAMETATLMAALKKQKSEIALIDAQKRKADNETALLGKELPKADLTSEAFKKLKEALSNTGKDWDKLKANMNSNSFESYDSMKRKYEASKPKP